MMENDFVEIYDCGQSTYVMNFNKNNIIKIWIELKNVY